MTIGKSEREREREGAEGEGEEERNRNLNEILKLLNASNDALGHGGSHL